MVYFILFNWKTFITSKGYKTKKITNILKLKNIVLRAQQNAYYKKLCLLSFKQYKNSFTKSKIEHY